MKKIIKLTTEGDVEGRTTKNIGYFLGSLDQIITYCILNNIHPVYSFSAEKINLIDVTDVTPKVKVAMEELWKNQDDYIGKLAIIKFQGVSEDLEKESKINNALSKLTDEEKKLLNLQRR